MASARLPLQTARDAEQVIFRVYKGGCLMRGIKIKGKYTVHNRGLPTRKPAHAQLMLEWLVKPSGTRRQGMASRLPRLGTVLPFMWLLCRRYGV